MISGGVLRAEGTAGRLQTKAIQYQLVKDSQQSARMSEPTFDGRLTK